MPDGPVRFRAGLKSCSLVFLILHINIHFLPFFFFFFLSSFLNIFQSVNYKAQRFNRWGSFVKLSGGLKSQCNEIRINANLNKNINIKCFRFYKGPPTYL